MSDINKIMLQWDHWRKQIAEGDTSSAPRDWFESVIDNLETELAALRAQVAGLEEMCRVRGWLNAPLTLSALAERDAILMEKLTDEIEREIALLMDGKS